MSEPVEVEVTGATEGAWLVTLRNGTTLRGTGPGPDFRWVAQLFTWDDVDLLRAMESTWEGFERTGSCPAEWDYVYVGDRFAEDRPSLADRLAALLPPRKTGD